MRVGLEGTAVLAHRLTGVQRYIAELARALAALEEPALECRLLLRVADFGKRRLLPPQPWPKRWYGPGGWPGTIGCDLVHALAVRLPGGIRKVPCVSTIHDLLAITLPTEGSARSRRKRIERYERATREADRIIAVSAETKAQFLAHFAYPEERVVVVHHGVSEAFLHGPEPDPERDGAPRAPYLLLYGGSERKNAARVLRAFAASSLRRSLRLCIVGALNPDAAAALVECRLEEAAFFEPSPDDERLARLYRASAGLLYPSLEEGFGLPILEAFACGVPVLTADSGATAEIAGGHAVLVEPRSIESIAAGIERLVATEPAARDAARRYARGFTWRRTAEQTLAVYRSLVG